MSNSPMKKLSTEIGGIVRPLLLLVFLFASGIGALLYGKDVIGFLEKQPPLIEPVYVPDGIGREGAVLTLQIQDSGAGIDAFVVRASQYGIESELKRESLEGAATREIQIPLDGIDGKFREGELRISVRAFDRSLWSNRGELELNLMVDYQSPELQVVTTQHNARVGGAQLLVYRAKDENLVESGVKVGRYFFKGYPARHLDPVFASSDLFAVIYAVPFHGDAGQRYSLVAQAKDQAGNITNVEFYSKESAARVSSQQVPLSALCLRGQVSDIFFSSETILREAVGDAEIERIAALSDDQLQKSSSQFRLVSEQLRMFDSAHLAELTRESAPISFGMKAFQRQSGTVRHAHQQKLSFVTGSSLVGELWHSGYFYRPRGDKPEIVAASAGIISFIEELGTYGTVIGIDHGLGLFSLYGSVEEVAVKPGDAVEGGDMLGVAGRGALGCERGALFELRVQGVPVEPAEWLSEKWFHGHISRKVASAKRLLGLAAPRSF